MEVVADQCQLGAGSVAWLPTKEPAGFLIDSQLLAKNCRKDVVERTVPNGHN